MGFLLPLSVGVITGLGASVIASRTAIGDRNTRLQIAKEDREYEQRRTACLNLEAQRITQLRVAKGLLTSGPGRKTQRQPNDEGIDSGVISEALVSLIMPDEIIEGTQRLNSLFDEIVVAFEVFTDPNVDWETKKRERERANACLKRLEAGSRRWRDLLRNEMRSHPRSSDEVGPDEKPMKTASRELKLGKVSVQLRMLTLGVLVFIPAYTFVSLRRFSHSHITLLDWLPVVITVLSFAVPTLENVVRINDKRLSQRLGHSYLLYGVACTFALAVSAGILGVFSSPPPSEHAGLTFGLENFMSVVICVFLFQGLDETSVEWRNPFKRGATSGRDR